MNLSDILTAERDSYLACYTKALQEHRQISPEATPELLIEINTQKIPLPYRYIRPDIIYKIDNGAKIIEVNKDRYFDFDPYAFTTASDISVILHPFYWNGIEFRLFGGVSSWDGYDGWIRKWIDLDDARSCEGKDFQGVIHNATEPEKMPEFFEFSVDMGSAEIVALSELLAVFAELGAGRVEIGSFSMIGPAAQQ